MLIMGLKILVRQAYLGSDISIQPKTYLKSETFGWPKLFWLITWEP